MTYRQTGPRWRRLFDICYDLERLDHPLHFGFTFRSNRETAIANAVRGRKVPVRGRRGNGYDCIPKFGSEFERIEQNLGPKADINIFLNRIIIPPSAEFGSWPHMNAGILLARAVAYDDGAAGYFVEVEADSRAVEKWLRENALPAGYVTGEGKARERGLRQAIRQAAKELWPNGVPTGLSNKFRDDKIRENLSTKGLRKPDDRTIRRAFGGQ
jgi:hypothetical protein